MEFKKVELINVPEVKRHRVDKSTVKPIEAKELQIGDLVLFGNHLLLIHNLIQSTVQEDMESGQAEVMVDAINLSTGIVGVQNLPIGTVFNRIIEADITELNEEGNWTKQYGWKRLRMPILDEFTLCGACYGECEQIKQRDIDGFEAELMKEPSQCGGLAKTYEPIHDVFQSYDGCEEPNPMR